jgi:hypothetical protein
MRLFGHRRDRTGTPEEATSPDERKRVIVQISILPCMNEGCRYSVTKESHRGVARRGRRSFAGISRISAQMSKAAVSNQNGVSSVLIEIMQ